jgi:hypothetical protein
VLLGETLAFTASVSNSTNTSVIWVVNGITGGSPQAGTISADGVYMASADIPQGGTVQVTAASHADPSKFASANVAISSDITVSISPGTVSVELGAAQAFPASISSNGKPDPALRWRLSGSSCPGSYGSVDANGNYIASQILPGNASVTLTATSAADPCKQNSANVLLTSDFTMQLSAPATGQPGVTAALVATMTPVPGSHPSSSLSRSLSGTGCRGSACGILAATTTPSAGGNSIAETANYTAPVTVPQPDTVSVTATRQADPTKKAQANITISSGANILSLHPASIYAGGADGFTVSVDGSGFAPSQPRPGSALQIGGTARVTICDSANSCTAPVSSTDVALAGNLSVQIVNPDAGKSNAGGLVIVASGNGEDVAPLTSSSPAATGKDITVIEPTSAGLDITDANLDLEVATIGLFTTSTNTCTLAGNPIPLVRPSSGTVAANICLFSEAGFDTSMSYTASGSGDVAVIAKQPAGLGIIHLTLQIPASAAPGARTLFIENANLDRTAASGTLEIR